MRASIGTIVVYWFTLVVGLVVFTATQTNAEVDHGALCSGVVLGTAFGQLFAQRRIRAWLLVVVVIGLLLFVGPFNLRNNDVLFWMSFVPAVFCGWASLSDRGSLFAFWFPAVVWMLSILDRGAGALKLDGASAALLGGLAFMFVAFLYARETRRVTMWKTIAPTPLARGAEPAILREVPRFRLGVTGWGIVASSVVFAVTAWLAPKLWHVEPLVPDLYAAHAPNPNATKRLPCCNAVSAYEVKRARVKEYLDIGRGNPGEVEDVMPSECVVCDADGVPVDLHAHHCTDGACTHRSHGVAGTGGSYGYGAPGYVPPSQYTPPTYTPPTYTPPAQAELVPPAYTPPAYTPPSYAPPVAVDPPPPVVAAAPRVEPEPPPAKPESPVPAPPPTIDDAAPERIEVPSSGTLRPPATRQAPGAPFLPWVLAALAGALALQVLILAMRPVRRLVTVRHLRRPFWTETVDQRVSNWWHLVLVGLRDAGWRSTSGEPPRELAKRLDIDGVERAAAILDRTRHGIGIDKADLAEMEHAAETAYRASRARATPFQRLLGWFRRPLV